MKSSLTRKKKEYKKALKLNSQTIAGSFSVAHAPAMIIPMVFGVVLYKLGVPRSTSVILTIWLFCTFLFAIKDKPERFLRRFRASKRKHWQRKLARSRSLFE